MHVIAEDVPSVDGMVCIRNKPYRVYGFRAIIAR